VALTALCVAKQQYDPSRGAFSNYATHKIKGYLRHQRDNRHAVFNQTMECRPVADMDEFTRDADPAIQTERSELIAAMRIAVRRLPEPERTCMQLQLANHSINEISRILDWRRVDVERIYQAGLGMLREQMDERFGNGKSEDADA
jgi:RNA polymerase sigma factor (sigma-70 family)